MSSLGIMNAGAAEVLSQALELVRKPALRRNTARAMRLNSLHAGRTVVVLGAGAQLKRISSAEEAWLRNQVVIGLNRTTYLFPWIGYFLSAYAHEIHLAAMTANPSTEIIHMPPLYRPPLVPGSLVIRREMFELDQRLPDRFSRFVPTILTRRNAALAATHLALVLGAKGIVYVGVDMKSQVHFYDEDDALRARMIEHLTKDVREELFAWEHPYATRSRMIERLRVPLRELREAEFYARDHTPTFEAYFAECRRLGVEVTSTLAHSVVRDAGAPFVPLSAFAMSQPGTR